MTKLQVATAPKTSTFQMRINPEIRQEAEDIFARCGLTLTDAFNVFLQQSLNAGTLPFLVTTDTRAALRKAAADELTALIQEGEDSAAEHGWISEGEAFRLLGLDR